MSGRFSPGFSKKRFSIKIQEEIYHGIRENAIEKAKTLLFFSIKSGPAVLSSRSCRGKTVLSFIRPARANRSFRPDADRMALRMPRMYFSRSGVVPA